MGLTKRLSLIAAFLMGGYLVLFPDPNRPAEIRGITGIPAKVSRAKIMRIRSQQAVRPKNKLTDPDENVTKNEVAPQVEDEE